MLVLQVAVRVIRTFLLVAAVAFVVDGQERSADLEAQVAELRAVVQKLQARVDELEARSPAPPSSISDGKLAQVSAQPQPEVAQAPPQTHNSSDLLHGTTVNFLLDTYYEYNFNSPIGRVNYLRAYDVTSNAFSLNQAAIVLENAPDLAKGKRYGARLDLQFGQATQTLQGNAANEPRPDLYRSVFQAYGTYIAPVGSGLTVDVGKWASALGIENNYTKDQMNYSRSYWFNFLPFYHMGVRTSYKLSNQVVLNYWITNGVQQTEPFKSFKDQFFGLNLEPHKTVNWAVNYYFGREHPDIRFLTGPVPAGLPTEQGLPFETIRPVPNGHLHIFDSYITWEASPNFTLALEADYVVSRLWNYSPPQHNSGGAAYARYQITPKFAVAGRAEYLSDRGGLFSGTTQALKETTLTLDYRLANGFLMRQEWRRDFSNTPFFLTDRLGVLNKEQNTATIGLVWWYGGKEGAW